MSVLSYFIAGSALATVSVFALGFVESKHDPIDDNDMRLIFFLVLFVWPFVFLVLSVVVVFASISMFVAMLVNKIVSKARSLRDRNN